MNEQRPELEHFPEWQRMENVDSLSPEQLDDLPFGAIELSADGKVLRYNAAESAISGRDRAEVLGRDFFTDVAPCTNVKEFGGRFREGVARGELNAVFPYLFDFRMQPTRVWVRLHYSQRTDTAWVFVTRQEGDD